MTKKLIKKQKQKPLKIGKYLVELSFDQPYKPIDRVYHNSVTCYCGTRGTLVSKLGENSGLVKCEKCGEEYLINTVTREELIPLRDEIPIL